MYSRETSPGPRNNRFDSVAEPFLQQPGLPFAEVLSGETIEQVFARHDGLFAEDDIYSTPLVLWAFLAQVLHGGKGAAGAAAVADIATYLLQMGGRVPSGDTGDYCRARAKLKVSALRELVVETAEQLQAGADPSWRWHGLNAKLVDGSTITMPDTEENQKEFPQQKSQKPSVGLPIARCCVVLSLATAALHDLAIGPYAGKETGENALLRGILDSLKPGEMAVFDRYYCSFMMLAMLQQGGVHFCTRLHQRRPTDFRRGKRLGPDDRLVTWLRPQKPAWMSEEQYAEIPETMTLRQVRFHVSIPGRRVETLIVVTSLTDPVAYPKKDIAELYGYRWCAEVNHRDEKQIIGVGEAQVRSAQSVERQPAFAVAYYSILLLAAAREARADPTSTSLAPPKWQTPSPPLRPPTQELIRQLRSEVWSDALNRLGDESDHFVTTPLSVTKWSQLNLPVASALLYAATG